MVCRGRYFRPGFFLLGPVILDLGGAQSADAMAVDQFLPVEEFFNREGIALAGVFEGEQAVADGGDHFGLAAHDPAMGAGGR